MEKHTTMSVLASDLAPTQRKAVEIVDRNVCVSAGAGTGKTRVLVERFIHLVENQLAHPHEILAITFTEKAAQEMKRRIAARLRESGLEDARRELENAYIGTIHSFCARILREHPIEASIDPDFRVLEEDEANLLKELVFEELVEARFQEPKIFNLLHVYGEKALRLSVSSVARKVHTSGFTLKNINSSLSSPNALAPAPTRGALFGKDLTSFSESVGDLNSGFPPKDCGNDMLLVEVFKALEPLKKLKGKENDCAEMETLLSKPISGWSEIEKIKEVARHFRKQGKAKVEIEAFRDVLDEWLGCQMESLAAGMKSSFLNFAIDFEARYLARKRERAGLDFDDLERKAVGLLGGSEPAQIAIRSLYQKHFKFIMVDEFQDTSPIQNQLIHLVKSGNNLFIVGDWKQSIYGFRGADASLFLEKEKEFSSSGEENYVTLTENFRSRPELINCFNPFFEKLWAEDSIRVIPAHAGIQRPLDSRFRGNDTLRQIPSIEFLTVERSETETIQEARIKEARVLAGRIKDLVGSGLYQYQDFAMLFRAADDVFFYEYELRNLGIPYYVISGRGFYHQLEIRDIISFLEVLDNPHLDIPLAAVLRSPLAQVADDTLFWLASRSISLKSPIPLYEALLRCEEISEIANRDRERLSAFLTFFLEFLKEKQKWSISELIERILERTRYDRYVLSLAQGKRHFANLRKLLELARELERREPIHLGDFIRYVKGLETQEVREAEAQVEALEGNVVKLMTVHKAKGLEFKVVILPDLNRKMKGETSFFLFDPEFGLGLKVFNEATRDFEKTDSFLKIKEKLIQNSREESKRLLYVAMTRAEDHLILSGASKANEDENGESEPDDPSNWYEWLSEWLPKEEAQVTRTTVQTLPRKSGRIPSPLEEHKKIRIALESGQPISDVGARHAVPLQDIIENLKPITPVFFERIDLPVSAFSVFEHDPEEYRRVYEIGALPEETAEIEEWAPEEDETEIKPAEFGTVVHKIFEYLVMHADAGARHAVLLQANVISRFAGDLGEKTREEIKTLSIQFLKSKLFLEIKNAKARYAEIPFVFRLQGGIVQGTLDLLYQTRDGQWVILDYKTSVIPAEKPLSSPNAAEQHCGFAARVSVGDLSSGFPPKASGNDIPILRSYAERYRTQLMLYALACHELLKIPVARASLYFVRTDQTFDFPVDAVDFAKLKNEFEALQKSIIEKRRSWVVE